MDRTRNPDTQKHFSNTENTWRVLVKSQSTNAKLCQVEIHA